MGIGVHRCTSAARICEATLSRWDLIYPFGSANISTKPLRPVLSFEFMVHWITVKKKKKFYSFSSLHPRLSSHEFFREPKKWRRGRGSSSCDIYNWFPLVAVTNALTYNMRSFTDSHREKVFNYGVVLVSFFFFFFGSGQAPSHISLSHKRDALSVDRRPT